MNTRPFSGFEGSVSEILTGPTCWMFPSLSLHAREQPASLMQRVSSPSTICLTERTWTLTVV